MIDLKIIKDTQIMIVMLNARFITVNKLRDFISGELDKKIFYVLIKNKEKFDYFVELLSYLELSSGNSVKWLSGHDVKKYNPYNIMSDNSCFIIGIKKNVDGFKIAFYDDVVLDLIL